MLTLRHSNNVVSSHLQSEKSDYFEEISHKIYSKQEPNEKVRMSCKSRAQSRPHSYRSKG